MRVERILVAVAVFVYLGFLYTHGWNELRAENKDLPSFFLAAHVAFDEGGSPYDQGRLARAGASLHQTIFPFVYPPPSLLAFYPLSFVSYRIAHVGLLALNHLIVLALLGLWFRRVRGDPAATTALAAAAIYLCSFDPLAVTIGLGQINLLVLLLLLLAWTGVRERWSDVGIGAPLSLAILLKTTPALLLPLLVLHRRYRAAIVTAVLLAAYCAAALFLLPFQDWRDWTLNILPTGVYSRTLADVFTPASPWNQNLNGLFAREFLESPYTHPLLVSPTAARLGALVACAIVLGIAAVTACRRLSDPHDPRSIDLAWAIGCATLFLVEPLSWEHHLVFVLPAIAVALWTAAEEASWPALVLPCACAFVIAWHFPYTSPVLSHGVLVLAVSAKLFGVLGLWARLIRVSRATG